MKFHDFQMLCKREFDNGRGDVGTLWLTEESYKELHDDVQNQGVGSEMGLRPVDPDSAANRRYAFNTVTNPMTRTIVRMRLARDTDVADVWYPDRHFETRFLDPEKAREMGIQI